MALDLDGTLLGPDGHISARSRQAVVQARAAGVEVVLVTARNFVRSQPFAQELGLELPIICCGGALIADSATGRAIHHIPVPIAAGGALVRFAHERRMMLVAHHQGAYRAIPRTIDDHPALTSLVLPRVDVVDGLESCLEQEVTFLRILGDAAVQSVLDEFGAEPTLSLVELRWRGVPDLGVYQSQVSKGEALKIFCSLHQIEQRHVLAMGDNASDASMLKAAGVGVAMANADESLKQLATFITASNADDGVALVLEAIRAS